VGFANPSDGEAERGAVWASGIFIEISKHAGASSEHDGAPARQQGRESLRPVRPIDVASFRKCRRTSENTEGTDPLGISDPIADRDYKRDHDRPPRKTRPPRYPRKKLGSA
jgi:hypothetical protein